MRAGIAHVLLVVVLSCPVAQPLAAQLSCDACHAELEFLRQRVPTLGDAYRLRVSNADIKVSAHEGTACSDCHTGFRRFPHPVATETAACASCHDEAQASWGAGIHAIDDNADCASCHGVHDVRTVDDLSTPDGIDGMRSSCGACHFEPRIPEDDPHAESVSCSACHGAHDTRPASDPESWVHVINQVRTCGACHDTVSAIWADDAHAAAVSILQEPGGGRPYRAGGSAPPACSSCHGSHGMLTARSQEPGGGISARCASCHEEHAETFADSYHGQASELGAEAVATCYDCHSGHGVYPSHDVRSTTSDGRLVDTCRGCHENATAGFAQFQPHADHNDRERYPQVYWSYRLMTGLLVGVFIFFGLHSALWLARSAIDRLRLIQRAEETHGH